MFKFCNFLNNFLLYTKVLWKSPRYTSQLMTNTEYLLVEQFQVDFAIIYRLAVVFLTFWTVRYYIAGTVFKFHS